MVTTGALLYGDKHRFYVLPNKNTPLFLQLGGADPTDLARCSQFAEDYGYDAVNLNVGCPSDRVQKTRLVLV